MSMYDAVIRHANENPAIVATVPAFQAALTAFSAKYSALVSTVQLEQTAITGVAVDKSVARANLLQQAADIAAAVFAYASATGNNTLKEQARYPISKLQGLRDELVKPACQQIHGMANTNLANLAPYGISAATITLFQAAIDNYEATTAKPRNAVSQRAAYKEAIKTIFREADDILKNQLDKIAPQFKNGNMDYYNAYTSNREILDPAVSSTQVQGTVVSEADLSPLQGVTITVEGKNYTALTALDGAYTLKTPKPGVYTLHFTKAGFIEKVLQLQTSLGNTTEADISLLPA